MKGNIKERKDEISLLNVLFCLAVIFIHIISYAVSAFSPNTLSYNLAMIPYRAVSFVVQGFVMLSGIKLFLTCKDKIPYKKYLYSRIKSIIIPYIICFIFYYFFYAAVYNYPFDIAFILKQFFTGNLVCHLYFIPIMVQFDLLFPLWKRIINKCSPFIVIPFCLLISQMFEIYFPAMVNIAFTNFSFMYNDRLFTTYLVFYVTDCYIGKYYNDFLNLITENFKTVCFLFSFSFVMFAIYTYLAFNGIVYVPFMNYIHYLYVFYVLIFMYACAIKIAPYIMQKFKIIRKIDQASYNIYLWHMMILFASNFIIEKLGVFSQFYSFIIRCIIVYGITIPMCIILNSFKRRYFNLNHKQKSQA